MVQLATAQRENRDGLMRSPLHEATIMGTNSSLSQRRTLSLTSLAGDLDSDSADLACHVLGPEAHPSLCFQNSNLTLLAHKPSRPGILEPHLSTLPAQHKEEMPYGVAQEPQMRIIPARSLVAPQFHRWN